MNDRASSQRANLDRLRAAFPWPAARPNVRPISWCLDAGGKHLVVEQIRRQPAAVVLEIGTFLGGSARQWLAASPDATVIAVDHWSGCRGWIRKLATRQRQPAWVIDQLEADEEATYQTFATNLWEYRDRLIPVRASSPDGLYMLARFGIQPDVIYLDADKTGRELKICHQLFPEAILTGDDWFMGRDRFWSQLEDYPIRKPVLDFCRQHERHLIVANMTWVISRERPSLRHRLWTRPQYELKTARRRVRGALRWLIGRPDRGAAAA